MTLDAGMHIAGALSLAVVAAVAAFILFEALTVQRHRILAALRLEPIAPADPVAPLATAVPQLRDDGSVTEPAIDLAA